MGLTILVNFLGCYMLQIGWYTQENSLHFSWNLIIFPVENGSQRASGSFGNLDGIFRKAQLGLWVLKYVWCCLSASNMVH